MFGLEKLFMGLTQKDRAMSKDRIARMLKDHPEALEAFEQAYTKEALTNEPASPENAPEATSTSRSRKPSKALSAAWEPVNRHPRRRSPVRRRSVTNLHQTRPMSNHLSGDSLS